MVSLEVFFLVVAWVASLSLAYEWGKRVQHERTIDALLKVLAKKERQGS